MPSTWIELLFNEIQKWLSWQSLIHNYLISLLGPIGAALVEILVWTILGALIVFLVIAKIIEEVKKAYRIVVEPLFYSDTQKNWNHQRRIFALEIKEKIEGINKSHSWRDYQFAELEAEVEAEGKYYGRWFVPWFLPREKEGRRKEKNLSRALQTTSERLILLQGMPGSGKSVTLRKVALTLAEISIDSKSLRSVIPIYVDLKGLQRLEKQPVNSKLIEIYLETFFEDTSAAEFIKGVVNSEGENCIFLFDSFDEIPEILSARDGEKVIEEYSDAIKNFSEKVGRANRVVVAARYFHSPNLNGWIRFKILELPLNRQREFLSKAFLVDSGKKLSKEDKKFVDAILRKIYQKSSQDSEIQKQAANPMFLRLIANVMNVIGEKRDIERFPRNLHEAYEKYISSRLEIDKDRIHFRYSINDTGKFRIFAEEVAFAMSTKLSTLSPTRDKILLSLDTTIFEKSSIHNYLDALIYMQLAKGSKSSDANISANIEKLEFSFLHRRFQEYFASCVILKHPDTFSIDDLLLKSSYREAAVVILQTRSKEEISPFLKRIEDLLIMWKDNFSVQIETKKDKIKDAKQRERFRCSIEWRPEILHLLSLLQDGFSSRLSLLPTKNRQSIGALLEFPFHNGTTMDQLWALELAGTVPEPNLIDFVSKGLASNCQGSRHRRHFWVTTS